VAQQWHDDGIEIDPAIDAAMRDMVKAGFVEQTELPELPPAAEKLAPEVVAGLRGRAGRRRR
jgi:hypothetical protein